MMISLRSTAPSVGLRRSAPTRATVVVRASSLFEKLGGREAVNAAVDKFYSKVLADERINSYFVNTDMKKQRAHQAAFLTFALGGPAEYKGKDMAAAHRGLVPHLEEKHFNAVVDDLESTLLELGVDKALVAEALAVVGSVKNDVLAE